MRLHNGASVQAKFMSLQDKYNETLGKVVPMIFKKSLVEIKEYLLTVIPRADVEECEDKDSLITLVTDRCSVAQCYLLYYMAKHFNQKKH